MTRRVALFALVLTLAGGLTAPAAAQEDSSTRLTFVSVDKRESPRITVTVAAPPELTAEDLSQSFEIRQDGEKRPVEATAVSGAAIEVAIVIDTSAANAGTPIDVAKSGALTFLEGLPPGVNVVVIGFGTAPYVASEMTTDRAAAVSAVQGLTTDGETAIYDAVAMALDQFSSAAQRSIVLISDGHDTASATTLDTAATSVAAAGVAFYGVALETADADPAALGELAQAAAGPAGPATNASDPVALAAIYEAIAAQYANQYQLTFEATGTGTTEIEARLQAGAIEAEVSRAVDVPSTAQANPAAAGPTLVQDPGNDWALPFGLAAVFIGLLITGVIGFAPRRRSREGKERKPLLQRGFHVGQLSELTQRATQLADRSLEQRGRRRALGDALEHAGIALRPGEFLVLGASMSIVGFALGVLLAGLVVGLVFAVVVLAGFRFSISVLAERRRSKFGSQLSDALQLLSGSLRAGYGMLQAIDAVAREADAPTAEEFGRIVIETRLGRDVAGSLHACARRMGNEDFEWVVQAIDIHREVGGDLTEVLDTVSGTIREREGIRRQIKALSAEGRLSAGILFALPLGMFVTMRVLNPEYLSELTGVTIGRVMIGIATLLLLAGGLWLRKIVRLEF